MLSWIKDFVGRWAGRVSGDVIDLVHWAVHALAGVVYTVFHHVGQAWHDMFAAGNWLRQTAWLFGIEVFHHLRHIVVVDIPHLFDWARARLAALEHWALAWIHRILSDLAALRHWAASALDSLRHWAASALDALRHWAASIIDMLWRKYIYPAWYLVTHPDKLAAILFWWLVGLLEDNAWAVGRRLGQFTVALVWHNALRLAQLAEDILNAVL